MKWLTKKGLRELLQRPEAKSPASQRLSPKLRCRLNRSAVLLLLLWSVSLLAGACVTLQLDRACHALRQFDAVLGLPPRPDPVAPTSRDSVSRQECETTTSIQIEGTRK